MTPLFCGTTVAKTEFQKLANVYTHTPDYFEKGVFSKVERKIEEDPQFLAAARAGDEVRALAIAQSIADKYKSQYDEKYTSKLEAHERGDMEPEEKFRKRIRDAKAEGQGTGGVLGFAGGGLAGAGLGALVAKKMRTTPEVFGAAGAAIGGITGAYGLGRYMGNRREAKEEAAGKRPIQHPGNRFGFEEVLEHMGQPGHPTYNRLVRGIEDPLDPLSGHVNWQARKVRDMEREMDAMRERVREAEMKAEQAHREASQEAPRYGSNPSDWNKTAEENATKDRILRAGAGLAAGSAGVVAGRALGKKTMRGAQAKALKGLRKSDAYKTLGRSKRIEGGVAREATNLMSVFKSPEAKGAMRQSAAVSGAASKGIGNQMSEAIKITKGNAGKQHLKNMQSAGGAVGIGAGMGGFEALKRKGNKN